MSSRAVKMFPDIKKYFSVTDCTYYLNYYCCLRHDLLIIIFELESTIILISTYITLSKN